MDASDGRLTADVRGEVETSEDGVLIIKRIHVHHLLSAAEDKRATIERVHGVYAEKCPVYRSVRAAIDVTSSFALVPAATGR